MFSSVRRFAKSAFTSKSSLLRDQRGAETVEKILILALFCFVAAVGMSKLGASAKDKLENQGKAIDGVEDTLPASK